MPLAPIMRQPLPVGFAMRSLLPAATSDTVTTSASVTPFSEMAVAAAAEAPGGVTTANATQAVTTMVHLLGFNPSNVVPTTTSGANATPDQQKLAVMLTAVSQLAASNALGCNTGSAGDKIWPYTTTFGLSLLWIAALLTLYTGYDYLLATIRHIKADEA